MALLLLWIAAVRMTSGYIISKAEESETLIIKEKNEDREKYLTRKFEDALARLNEASKNISENLDVRKNISKSDMKKLYETVFGIIQGGEYSVEIFDKRIEQVYFEGRQIFPEIILIQKALTGQQTTLIKETGFFTYLIKYVPVYNIDDETKVQ